MFLLKAILSLQICLPTCGHQKLWLFPDFPEMCSSNVPYVWYCCHRGAETQKVKMCFPMFEMDTLSHVMSFYMMDLHVSCRSCSSIREKKTHTRIVWNVFY